MCAIKVHKKIQKLPKIKGLSKSNSDYSLINISAINNNSLIKNNSDINSSIPCQSHRILQKIKLIKNKNNNSEKSLNKSQIYSYRPNKELSKIIKNVDNIMKERIKFRKKNLLERKYLVRNASLKLSKDISYKNYCIKLLKEKRMGINKREILINKTLNEYEVQYEKDYRKFMNLVEDIKLKERNDFETLIEYREKKEEKEKLLENEISLNKNLNETLSKKIKELYKLKNYGSFFHQLLEKDFIYDGIPEYKPREKNQEEISDSLINIYETKDKNTHNPEEIKNEDFFMKKCIELEEKVISHINNKEFSDKEIEKVKKKYEKDLEKLKLSKIVYENDLNFLKNEKKNVIIEIKNYKSHKDEIFEDYLKYIIELSKEIEPKFEIPKIVDKKYLIDIVVYSEKVIKKLKDIENIVNNNILEIENVLEYGNKKDKEIMDKIILKQINTNKKKNN